MSLEEAETILARGEAWYNTLTQSTLWRTQDGELVRIAEMSPTHARNLQRWLDKRANTIVSYAYWGSAWKWGQWAEYASETVLADMDGWADAEANQMLDDPLTWLQQTAFYEAVAARACAEPVHVPDCTFGGDCKSPWPQRRRFAQFRWARLVYAQNSS